MISSHSDAASAALGTSTTRCDGDAANAGWYVGGVYVGGHASAATLSRYAAMRKQSNVLSLLEDVSLALFAESLKSRPPIPNTYKGWSSAMLRAGAPDRTICSRAPLALPAAHIIGPCLLPCHAMSVWPDAWRTASTIDDLRSAPISHSRTSVDWVEHTDFSDAETWHCRSSHFRRARHGIHVSISGSTEPRLTESPLPRLATLRGRKTT